MEFTSDKAGLMKDGLPQHMVVWPYYAGVHVTAIKPTISGLYFVQISPLNQRFKISPNQNIVISDKRYAQT
jgi:hypothetical protein